MSTRERILHSMTRSDAVRHAYGVCRSVPILGSALQKISHAVMPMGTRLWIRIPQGVGKGLWMYVDPRLEMGYANGDHEPWVQAVLKAELPPDGCYYDVGAHSGFFCMIAVRCVGPLGSVIAIEADPYNAETLRRNMARNHLVHVSVIETAIWSSAGRLTFLQAPDSSNRTQGRVLISHEWNAAHVRVSATRLDDLVFARGYRPPDLVKMDIEGAEWEALQGAQRLLTEVKPKILCEVHDVAQMGQIRAYFEQFDYRTEEWRPVHPHYTDYRQVYLWAAPCCR